MCIDCTSEQQQIYLRWNLWMNSSDSATKKYEVYSLCPLYFYQLLALTIQQEKPELETEKTRLLQQEEDKKIQLAQLEESLLEVCTHTHTHTLQSSVEGKTSWRRKLQVFLP